MTLDSLRRLHPTPVTSFFFVNKNLTYSNGMLFEWNWSVNGLGALHFFTRLTLPLSARRFRNHRSVMKRSSQVSGVVILSAAYCPRPWDHVTSPGNEPLCNGGHNKLLSPCSLSHKFNGLVGRLTFAISSKRLTSSAPYLAK